jgi:hypothetical protein
MKDNYITYLEWLYLRMKHVYNENENYDYMIRFREIIDELRKPTITKNTCDEIFDRASEIDDE